MSLSAADLSLRKQGLSATDVVTLATAGTGGFGSPLDVYLSKVSDEPGFQGNMRTAMGHAAEPVIMTELAKVYGLTLVPCPTVRHRLVPHFLATPDRLAVDAKGTPIAVCEGKLVGWRMCRRWYDEDGEKVFPDEVAVQVAFQEGVMRSAEGFERSRVDRGYVGAMLGDFGEDAFHHTVMPWKGAVEDLWFGLCELADRFWKDHVLARVPPTPDGSERTKEAIEKMFPSARKPILAAAPQDVAELMARYVAVRDAGTLAEKAQKEIANQLRLALGKADVEGMRSATHKVTWRERVGNVSISKIASAQGWSESDLEKFRGESSRTLLVNNLSSKEIAHDATLRDLAAE